MDKLDQGSVDLINEKFKNFHAFTVGLRPLTSNPLMFDAYTMMMMSFGSFQVIKHINHTYGSTLTDPEILEAFKRDFSISELGKENENKLIEYSKLFRIIVKQLSEAGIV